MKPAYAALIILAFLEPAKADFSIVSSDQPSMEQPATPLHQLRKPTKPSRHPKSGHALAPARTERRLPMSHDALAKGFGAGVPLTFAIRQIVPDGYKIILEPPVDPVALVDWNGGKAWPSILAAALKPLGLAAAIANDVVTIRSANAQ